MGEHILKNRESSTAATNKRFECIRVTNEKNKSYLCNDFLINLEDLI